MKIALVAIAALCIFDAIVWKGAYRISIVHTIMTAGHFVGRQNWTWLK
jgi:hypothetical protein